MKVIFVFATLALVALAEPPAPNQNSYLPPGRSNSQYDNAPSSQYGAPDFNSAPSSQYGAPSQNGNGNGNGARNTYAPPAARVHFRFGSSGGKSGGRNGNGNGNGYPEARTPSSQYGAPNGGARSQFGDHKSSSNNNFASSRTPSSQYGAPQFNSAPSSQYGAPARSNGNGNNNQYAGSRSAAPSSQYGAPSNNQFNSRAAAPSSQYGAPQFNSAPSSQYGAPQFNSAPSAPSSQYGAPQFNSAPSSQYGAPSRSANNNQYSNARNSAPSSQYGAPQFNSAPSSQYGAPSAQQGFNAPSVEIARSGNGRSNGGSQYSRASAQKSSQFGGARNGAPSSQYGAPQQYNSAPSSSYGAPAPQFNSAPSSSYGAPQQYNNAPSTQYGAPSSQYGAPARSASTEDPLAEPASYEFQYDVNDAASGSDFGHKEGRDGESSWGEYRVALPDGRTQIVKYEADENGYKPQIEYQEAQTGYPESQRNGGGPY